MKVDLSGTNPLYSIFLKNVQSHFLKSVGLCNNTYRTLQ